MHRNLAEGWYCDFMKGTTTGGLHKMFEACEALLQHNKWCNPYSCPTDIHANKPMTVPNEEVKEIIYSLFILIIDESHGSNIFLHHLMTTLLLVQRSMKKLKSELDLGLLHPRHARLCEEQRQHGNEFDQKKILNCKWT